MITPEILGNIKLYNCDCMEYMKTVPDNYFDLAIVDPPYGIGEDGGDKKRRRKGQSQVVKLSKKDFDKSIPLPSYFKELKRVSKNQVIFGANYMVENLLPSMGWVVWDKGIAGDFSDCELAFSSFNKALKKYYVHYMEDYNGKWFNKIHPNQKPVRLYANILKDYAKPGDKIFDSHFGSLSIGIACHDLGFELTACELDSEYYEKAKQRLKNHQKQLNLFEL